MSRTTKSRQRRKRSEVGGRVIAGLTQFRDALRGSQPLGARFTVRRVGLDLGPAPYDAAAVRATRRRLSVSQAVFAELLGVSVDSVQSWEQGVRVPSKMARRFMDEIRHDPQRWVRRLQEAAAQHGSAA